MAIEIETNFWPFKVLNMILAIEEKMGRIRSKKWESRIIDIDILFFNEVSISSENLSIPHPYIQKGGLYLSLFVKYHPIIFIQNSENQLLSSLRIVMMKVGLKELQNEFGSSNSHRSFYAGIWVVIDQFKIFEFEIKN